MDATSLLTNTAFDIQLSNFFYVKREAKKHKEILWNGEPHPIVANDWSVAEYLDENKRSYMMNFFPPETSMDNYQEVLNRYYVHIGVAEYLQQSVNSLAQKLDFKPVNLQVKNASEWNESIPAEVREEFIENNQLEYAVYEYAKNMVLNS